MKLALSIPSGYHARELLLPLQSLLTNDPTITAINVITPAAPWYQELFPDFSAKFHWHTNPSSPRSHQSLLSAIAPDVVLTPTIGLDLHDVPIINAARHLNIPTVTFVASWDNVYKIARLIKHGYAKHTRAKNIPWALPDHLAVWNQLNTDHLLQLFPQLSPDRVTITGPPRFDYFSHHDRIPSKKELFAYLNIKADADSTHLIHCATTELYPFSYIIKNLHHAIHAGSLKFSVELYASVHPGGNMAKHHIYEQYGVTTRYSFGRRESAPHPNFLYLPTLPEIYYLVALFRHSSVLINQSSTVAIESMMADVPVINVMYGQTFDWWRWYRSMVYRDFNQHYRYITDRDSTTIVRTPRLLIQAVNSCLSHPDKLHKQRSAAITDLVTYTDGGNSNRLIELAKRIA